LVRGAGVNLWFARVKPNFWPEHSHVHVQVAIFLDAADCGVGWRTPGGESVQRRIDGNHVWILPPDHPHEVSLGREAGLVVLYLEKAWAGDVAPGVTMEATVRPLSDYVFDDPLIGELVRAFRDECAAAAVASRPHVAALGAMLGARLLRARAFARPGKPGPPSLTGEALERVKTFIAQHLQEKLPLKVLAREGRYSPSHFSRLFRGSTGYTPERYLLRTRLFLARELLETSGLTVSEIAHRVGFCDHSHLTTQFKEMFRETPTAFRRRCRR
jgi:AraC family transcriptional regulator